MRSAFSAWMARVHFEDPLEQRQAGLVQSILVGLIAVDILSLAQTLVVRAEGGMWLSSLYALVGATATASLALWLVRRRHMQAGVLVATVGMLITVALFAALLGILHNPLTLATFTLPLALAGLLGRRRVMLAVALVALALLGTIGALESMPDSPLHLRAPAEFGMPTVIGSMAIVLAILCVFYDRVRTSLHQALRDSLAREQDLERLQAGLEQTVAARTAELQATVDQLQASQATVRELGAPVLPVLPGVLVAPVIGAVDSTRAADLSAAVLDAIDRTRARAVIFDITGVPVVDTQVAQALLKVAQAARLLGAEALLVGVSAEVAQTMVTLGVSLGAIRVFPNLQGAIAGMMAEVAETHGSVRRL